VAGELSDAQASQFDDGKGGVSGRRGRGGQQWDGDWSCDSVERNGRWRRHEQHPRHFSQLDGCYGSECGGFSTTALDDMVTVRLFVDGAPRILGVWLVLVPLTDVVENPGLTLPSDQGRPGVGIVLTVLINEEGLTRAGRYPGVCDQAKQVHVKAHACHLQSNLRPNDKTVLTLNLLEMGAEQPQALIWFLPD